MLRPATNPVLIEGPRDAVERMSVRVVHLAAKVPPGRRDRL